jgi:hypothetical protein
MNFFYKILFNLEYYKIQKYDFISGHLKIK